MPVLGLVVEGEYDASALKSFLSKQLNEQPDFVVRICGGPIRKLWLGLLEEFRLRVEAGEHLDQAIVLMDSGDTNPESVLTALENKKNSKPPYPFPVIFSLAVRELEAWLLADEQALSELLCAPISRIEGNIEEHPDPKGELEYLLIMKGVGYTKEVAGSIASLANLLTVQDRCSWFGRLLRDAE